VRAIIGLGNPGKRYQHTRHNIGYRLVDYFVHKYEIPFKAGRGDYYYGEHSIVGERIVFFKPTAFMNLSGLAVDHILGYFPLQRKDLLIVYDDFNLPLGTLRFRALGSDGGHNGIRSIIYHLNSEEFDRLRIGIGNQFNDAVDHVLSKFTNVEIDRLNELLPIVHEAVICWIKYGVKQTMNQYNRSYFNTNCS
jgi:PTH1 family peptidyl-tRNA hydrolase